MYWRQVKSAKKAMKKLPVSAKAVVVSKDGQALVMRKYDGTVDLPGGKVEKKENLYDALAREIEEEIGIEAKTFEFVSSWVKHSAEKGDRLVIVFETQLEQEAQNIEITLSDEHVWGEFMHWDKAEELAHMTPGFANALQICDSRALARK